MGTLSFENCITNLLINSIGAKYILIFFNFYIHYRLKYEKRADPNGSALTHTTKPLIYVSHHGVVVLVFIIYQTTLHPTT